MEDQQDLTSRIKSYIKQDNFKDALILTKAQSEEKGNKFFKYYVGLSHKLLGQLEEALNVFEDFEEEQYKNIDEQLMIELLQNMAEIYLTKELYAKSAEYYLRLLELDRNVIFYYNQAIISLIKINRLKEAEAVGKQGIATFPRDQQIVINLARTYQCQRNLKEAIVVLEQCMKKENSSVEIKLLLSDIYYDMLMFNEAEKLNQLLLDENQSNLDALINMAKLKLNSLDISQALFYSKRGLDANPDISFFYYSQAICMHIQGNITEGIQAMEMACTLDQSKNYTYSLSLILMYIEKGYLTEDKEWYHTSDLFLKRGGDIEKQSHNFNDNPIFQYLQALIYRLMQQQAKFQNYWNSIFHITPANMTPMSRHPSQDIYDQLDDSSKQLLGLIPVLDFFSVNKSCNSKIEREINNQKTLLLFQILKATSIPSLKIKKQQFIEKLSQINNLIRYSEICSEEYQSNNQQINTSMMYSSPFQDQLISLNIYEMKSETEQKRDKAIDEFMVRFLDITSSLIELTNAFFKNGLKIASHINTFSKEQQKIIVIISTVELDEFKKGNNCTVDDLNLHSKLRKLQDIARGGTTFKEQIQLCLNSLEWSKIKQKISKKEGLKKYIGQLNQYKINDDLFVFKSAAEALAIEYACKFYSTLLMDNQPTVKYTSYSIYYSSTLFQTEQIYIIKEVFKQVDNYSSKNMRESFILTQKLTQEKCCSIF